MTWLEKRDRGILCPTCGLRGMRRLGMLLYRCERPDCMSRGDVRRLIVWGGYPMTLNVRTAIALDEHRKSGARLT